MSQSPENLRADRRTDGQTLFYRTLSGEAGGPLIDISLFKTTHNLLLTPCFMGKNLISKWEKNQKTPTHSPFVWWEKAPIKTQVGSSKVRFSKKWESQVQGDDLRTKRKLDQLIPYLNEMKQHAYFITKLNLKRYPIKYKIPITLLKQDTFLLLCVCVCEKDVIIRSNFKFNVLLSD